MARRRRLLHLLLLVGLAGGAAVACSEESDPPAPSATTVREEPVKPETLPDSTLPGEAAALGPVHTVPVGDITIGYRQFGNGDPLVLVMGQTAPMSLWPTSFLQALAADHRVTIFDNRGVGYSTDDPEVPLTIPLMADDTAGFIGAVGLERADVLGWSTGGEIGLAIAVDHQDVLDHLVVVAGLFGGGDTVLPPQSVLDLFADPNAPDEQVLALLYPDDAGDAVATFVDHVLTVPQEELTPEIIRRQAEAEDAFAEDFRIADALSDVDVAMLVVAGAEDEAVPPENSELIAERVPGARLEIIEGAGHAVLFQIEDTFIALVNEFLAT